LRLLHTANTVFAMRRQIVLGNNVIILSCFRFLFLAIFLIDMPKRVIKNEYSLFQINAMYSIHTTNLSLRGVSFPSRCEEQSVEAISYSFTGQDFLFRTNLILDIRKKLEIMKGLITRR